jgi:hypothetical protein
MSTSAGPNVSANGLAFAYDMNNTQKSWKGAAATNYIISQVWGGDYAGNSFTQTITDSSLQYNGLPTSKLTNASSNFNCYITGGNVNQTLSSSNWTFLCYIRRSDKQPIPSLTTYLYAPSTYYTGCTVTALEDGWYRMHLVWNGTSSSCGLVGFTGLLQNVEYYMSGACLTPTSYPVDRLAPNITRSSTQAVLDLTKTNTATIGSLTYSADGTFSFNGTSDYIDFTNKPVLSGTTQGTVSAIIKIPSAATDYACIYSCETGPSWNDLRTWMSMYGANQIRFTVSNGSASTTGNCVSTVLQYNTPYMITGTYDGSNVKIYVNGILNASYASTIVPGTFTPTITRIGHHYSTRFFNGTIYALNTYNRALTAAEVQSNFAAYRGRYGI